MRSTPRWLSLPILLLLAVGASAKEAAREFLDQLRSRGYGEASLDYLAYLKENQLVPDDVTADWDLYEARAWRLAIGEAFNTKEVAQRREKAQALLEKFLKEHPDSSLAAEEVAEWGTMGLKDGLHLSDLAQASKDPERKTKLIAEARAALDAAKIRLTQAVEMGAKLLAEARAANPEKRGRRSTMSAKQKAAADAIDRAELFWMDAKFKLAKVDFFNGQTYVDDTTDPGKQRRAELLKQAAAVFYDIYQGDRTSVAGLLAHTWEGKTADALGDQELAQDIYDEVLVLTPDASPGKNDSAVTKVDAQQQNLFSEVKYFSLLITLKKQGEKEFLASAEPWLRDYKAWARNDGYQGIALETAKLYLAQAEKSPADRKKLRAEAETLLKAMRKFPSEYHQAAVTLARTLHSEGGKAPADADPKTLEEATALADDASDGQQWEEAVKWYTKALEFTGKLPKGTKRQDVEASLAEKIDTSRYNFGCQLQAAGKDTETIALAKPLLEKVDRHGELAPRVAALWVRAALHAFATAPDQGAKDAALKELTEATKMVIDTWPDKAEADDARISLGQASLVQGKAQEALAAFEQVNQRSLRYPLALLVAAQTHLRLMDQEQKKPMPDADVVAKELAAARERLEKSVGLQIQAASTEPAAVAQSLESRLLLAQVYLLASEPAKAVELLQPIVDGLKDAAPAQLDATTLKAFKAAVSAYAATGQLAAAGSVASVLLDRGQDDPQVNAVLLSFGRTLLAEFKLANAASIEAASDPDLSKRVAAEPRLTAVKELTGNLLPRLAERKSISPPNMIFIGDLAMQVGQSELASTIYHRILDQAAADPAFAKQCGPGVIRVRSQLIELLREKKTPEAYAEGLKQADALIEQVPKALEPLMAKGRLLQAWAEQDQSKFPEAVAHWSTLRAKLEPMRKKPSEYYEVNYNVALCLYLEAQKTGDKSKAASAQQVLNAQLIRSPKLDGPDTVARYRKLLADAQKEAGNAAPPAAAAPAASAPASEKLGASK